MKTAPASNTLLVRIVSLLYSALCGGKKSEIVYCRFDGDFYDMVKARAKAWEMSHADAVQRLAFIGEMATAAIEQSMVRKPLNGQDKLCLESANGLAELAEVG